MMNHDDDNDAVMDESLSQQPSSSPSSPLRPIQFEYTPPTHPFNPPTFFSDIMRHGVPPPPAAPLSYEEQQDMVIEPSWLTLALPSYSPSPQPQPLTPSISPPRAIVPAAASISYQEQQDMVIEPSWLTLSLPFYSPSLPPPPQPLTPSLSPPHAINSSNSEEQESPSRIQPPFPWATSKPATVHTLDHLLYDLNIKTISGTLECKNCNFKKTDIRFDLLEKFEKVASFFMEENMNDRAPDVWMKPEMPNCTHCGKKSGIKPLIGKDEEINWLFLFLGEMLGCCNLDQLRYFCKQANIHRTGAKDRLLYHTYLGLCKQLQPQ